LSGGALRWPRRASGSGSFRLSRGPPRPSAVASRVPEGFPSARPRSGPGLRLRAVRSPVDIGPHGLLLSFRALPPPLELLAASEEVGVPPLVGFAASAPLPFPPSASTPGSLRFRRVGVARPRLLVRPRGFAPPRRFAPRTGRGFVAPRFRLWGPARFGKASRPLRGGVGTFRSRRRGDPSKSSPRQQLVRIAASFCLLAVTVRPPRPSPGSVPPKRGGGKGLPLALPRPGRLQAGPRSEVRRLSPEGGGFRRRVQAARRSGPSGEPTTATARPAEAGGSVGVTARSRPKPVPTRSPPKRVPRWPWPKPGSGGDRGRCHSAAEAAGDVRGRVWGPPKRAVRPRSMGRQAVPGPPRPRRLAASPKRRRSRRTVSQDLGEAPIRLRGPPHHRREPGGWGASLPGRGR
jgi:hypothetical protein